MRRSLITAVGMLVFVGTWAAPRAGASSSPYGPAVAGLCGTATMSQLDVGRPGVYMRDDVQVIGEDPGSTFSTPFPVDVQHDGTYARPSDLPSPQPVINPGPGNNEFGSFLLHWDPPADVTPSARRTVTIGFNGPIAGVQILANTVAAGFRAPGTYPTDASGLHLTADGSGDRIRIFDGTRAISISMTRHNPGFTELRVITRQDPEPGVPAYPGGLGVGTAGTGYTMVGGDGGVFVFPPDWFAGSLGAAHLNQPIVGIATTPTGDGYWLVASDGGIFAFGDAPFDGSTGAIHLNKPIVGMRAAPTGNGYYLFASDGGVFTFGNAAFYGSAGASGDTHPFVGMRLWVDGIGYGLVDDTGRTYGYGDARAPAVGVPLASPIVGAY